MAILHGTIILVSIEASAGDQDDPEHCTAYLMSAHPYRGPIYYP